MCDALRNAAPVVAAFSAKGDFGRFPVDVRGIEGVYFVSATEFDDLGYFERLDDAIAAAWMEYGGCDMRPEGQLQASATGERSPGDQP